MAKIIRLSRVVKSYEDACLALAFAVNHRLFNESRDFSWVGDEVGGLCDFEDADFLDPQQMAYIIKNKITYKQYAEWRDANLQHEGKYINLPSWFMGLRHDMINETKDANR